MPADPKKLSPWAAQAEPYWRKFRPKLYQALEKSGQLEQELNEAAHLTGEALDELMLKGRLQFHEAWELVREEWLYPPPREEEVEEESQGPEKDESS